VSWCTKLSRRVDEAGALVELRLGHPLVDDYLVFVGARLRPNSWLAVGYDLKVFFAITAKEPTEVTSEDVFAFLAEQRTPRLGDRVVRIEDGESGLAARTLRRRLSSVSGLFDYLQARELVERNPVPRGSLTRRARSVGGPRKPLIRTPRKLPQVLSVAEADAFLAALRTSRDRTIVMAMLFGGLRRCEVLGLRMRDVRPGERRLFVSEGKGGHQRLIPVSQRFFDELARYLAEERPETSSDHLFVVLKADRRGRPLSASGLDQIVDAARRRAGLRKLTCHQLRHTCLTRLREAGMPLEAVQAQAGHRSLESTRIYLHLSNDWLAQEYLAAAAAIEADSVRILASEGAKG
jgi:integrase/recombinase XerD